MQLHTLAYVLACPHTCANMCPITSEGTLTSLTYCTHVLHKGLHTCICSLSGYIHIGTYTYDIGVSPTCSRQSLKSIVLQGAYSSDIISGYYE